MIKLLRNREVRRYFAFMLAIGAIGTACCAFLGGFEAGIMAGIMAVALLTVSLLFTKRRYDDVARLAALLGKLAAGGEVADLREYREGELSILYDELQKVSRALSHQAEALRRDKRWLADTMADISHQLRTPLTSVAMMTDLLSERSLPPDRRAQFLDAIRQSAERIRWLVVSLLKLSRLDADAVTLAVEELPVAELIDRALLPHRIPMELMEQELALELEDFALPCDPGWLSEAISNLLHNCVEHTPRGGKIGVRAKDNPLYRLIEVWDSGPGIPPEDLPRLFERFYRGKNASPESIGIGLALSRSIVTRHGGTLEAVSTEGQGALFRVKLYRK